MSSSFRELIRNISEGIELDEEPISTIGWKKGDRVEHPLNGTGVVSGVYETSVSVDWDNVNARLENFTIDIDDANRMTLLDEGEYSDDSDEAEIDNDDDCDKEDEKLDESMIAIPSMFVGSRKMRFADELNLTAADLGLVTEDEGYEASHTRTSDNDNGGAVPVRTKTADMKPTSSEPLSAIDMAAKEGPRDDDKLPSDAPKIPKPKMVDGGNSVPVGNMSKGVDNTGSNSSPKKTPKSEKSPKNDDNNSEKEVQEAFDMEDDMMEHDMASGEIAVDQEFMKKLLSAVVEQGLDQDKVDMLVSSISDCCDEDRTLTTDDIGDVMDKLMQKVNGGSDAPEAGDAYEDKAAGDGEIAGPEGGEEHEGKTKIMADVGSDAPKGFDRWVAMVEKYTDQEYHISLEDLTGGNEEMLSRAFDNREQPSVFVDELAQEMGLDSHADVNWGHSNGERPEHNFDECNGDRKQMDEAWMGTVPLIRPSSFSKLDTSGMSEDEAELAWIKNRAGI